MERADDRLRSTRPRRSIAATSSSRRVVSFRSTWSDHAGAGEAGERLVERRQLRRELAQLGERAVAHGADSRAVAHLVQVVRVREDERAAGEVEHVELDRVDARRERDLERAQRVLGRERGRAAVADPDQRAVSAQQPHRVTARRQEVLVERAALGGELDDHPVGDPFDRRAVVRPRVARIARTGRSCRASRSRSGRDRPGPPDASSGRRAPAGRRRSGLVEAQRRPDARPWSNSWRQRARRSRRAGCRRRAPIATLSARIPPGVEPLAREPEELARREVEGHVRLVVGVDDDQVVALVRPAQERPRVGVVHRQARVVAPSRTSGARRASRPGRARRRRSRARVVDAERARDRAAALPRIATERSGRPSSGGSARNTSHTPPVSTVSRRQTEWTATPSLR